MDFTLDLLENSYDYISESLVYYKAYGYIETHDPDRDDIITKRKWKTTFILLVQAIELLIKEKLSRINSQLLYENIDVKNDDDSKTISFSKALDRLMNFDSKTLKGIDIDFIKQCIRVRNNCIHYKINMNSIEIKRKYCMLFEQYKILHKNIIHKKYVNDEYKFQLDDIELNAKDLIVYRGNEYRKKELEKCQKHFKYSQNLCYGIAGDFAYKRIKYGEEIDIYKKRGYEIDLCRYCGDCAATYGEYHDLGCDCELCPKCGKQLISCECFDEYGDLEYVNKKNKRINKDETVIN